jgi:putative zinc-binding metallo-peptidase
VQQAAATPRPAPRPDPPWAALDDEALLDVRMCDLGVTIEGSGLEPRLQQLESELEARGLVFRPHYWLSDEWFCPDGVPGMAIPFYLAHPRLARLEQAQMLEVEGGTFDWCLKILRHEAGHAIDNAFKLRKRRRRRELFGSSSAPYPKYYLPRPYSKSFVIHLDAWYAQSHPDEDFAETFAVWLDPAGDWRSRYADWPAHRKLEYIEGVMRGLAGKTPPIRTRRMVGPLPKLKKTLRQHYQSRRTFYGLDHPDFYDRDLRRLFSDDPQHASFPPATAFVTRFRKEARRRVGRWTGTYQYTIDQVIGDIVRRCRELKLRMVRPEEETKLEFIILLTVQTMNYLGSGRHRVAL